jgi:hypothetical protein
MHIDIKKSTHKKLSKWLSSKAAEGLVSLRMLLVTWKRRYCKGMHVCPLIVVFF